ncbi:MAG: electron transfer flavoprotein subunit beta/FixA family protein [Candidatus Caenarcaniphilales bacterium]|nr:electron transfer flavoprotein subunit beta/FixA family protein [Candidatus Caenarcaniphilales bacterium]
MSQIKNIYVLAKQVPDQSAKAGINADGTIDRAKAKRMMNPFDKFALQAALETKKRYGGRIKIISMGPPAAEEILLEALEHGADDCCLLSDRRLAASDTLATSYAIYKVVKYLEPADLIFCGLQTTDGDTAQVGPSLAERLGIPQVTYCEDFKVENGALLARRVIEGGYQWVRSQLPTLVTVANSYHHLEYKTIRGAKLAQSLLRSEEEKRKLIKVITLDDIGADPVLCGLKGSPTIVAKTDKVSEIGGSCHIIQGHSSEEMVKELIGNTNIKEFVKV